MELSSADSLRLNVLLRQPLKAIRINEQKMEIIALTDQGESKMVLTPTVQDENYLRMVRQQISSYVLGSPGGYPVYIKRWTRMGQNQSTSADKLLLLGEPEAVTAAVYAPDITAELAELAWWCEQSSEHARELLKKNNIRKHPLGKTLAQHILEFLPFETEGDHIMQSVALILQGDLLDTQAREKLWKQAQRKNAYRAGFLLADAKKHPQPRNQHIHFAQVDQFSHPDLGLALSATGQTFLYFWDQACDKLVDQEVVIALFNRLGQYLNPAEYQLTQFREWHELEAYSQAHFNKQALATDLKHLGQASFKLGQVNETLLNPIFAGSDASGSVMRKQLKPVLTPIREQIQLLLAG